MNEFKDNIKKDSSLPLVSILIPLYNAEQYIGGLLDWCLRQPYKNIEVVVVDDHSTDKSYSIAKKYESDRVHVLTNPKKGAQSARNFAFENSKGRFVKFHDADDYSSDNIILRQVERMLKDGDDDTIVFSSRYTLDKNGCIGTNKGQNDRDFTDPIDFLYIGQWSYGFHCPHSFLLNRQTVEKAGGWKEDVQIFQDTLFFTKAVEQASKMLYVENEYAIWRIFDEPEHVSKRTPEKLKNGIHTICEIANTVLKYRNNEETHKMVSEYIGHYIYRSIFAFRPILPYVDEVCKQNGLEWTKIKSPRLGLLYSTLGWVRTTELIQGWKKVKMALSHAFRSSLKGQH